MASQLRVSRSETGPCGMAASLKTQVIASDVASDTHDKAQTDFGRWRTA